MLKKIIVGVCGASGTNYALTLLKELKKQKVEAHLVLSEWAEKVSKAEGVSVSELKKLATKTYKNSEMGASISSSSFLVDAMVVLPASVKTCSEIATAHTSTLITRCADNALRYRKPLVVCLRETPLSGPCLENLTKITQYGGIVMPLSPGFYNKPKKISDLEAFIAGKVMDLIGLDNDSYKRWE